MSNAGNEIDNKLLIVGLGGLGGSIIEAFSKNGIEADSFDVDASKKSTKKSLEDALYQETDIVFLCIPTHALENTAKQLVKFENKVTAVSFSKGLNLSGQNSAEILSGILLNNNFVIAGGPLLSADIQNGKASFAVLGTEKEDVLPAVRDVLQKISISSISLADPSAVALCGVLKNIYAIAFGVAEGLNFGNNFMGALTVAVTAEMDEILTMSGVSKDNKLAIRLAGLGDVVASGFSETSRHRNMGLMIAKGQVVEEKGEGYISAPILAERLTERIESLPVLNAVANIITGKLKKEGLFDSVAPCFRK